MSPTTGEILEEAPAALEATAETIGGYRVHPAADIFPVMSVDEYKNLHLSIKTHGLVESITLYEATILDGRHRARACVELGIELRTEPYEGDDPLGFVMAKNLTRRHLNISQRSMVAAKLANMKQGERTDLRPLAKSQKVSQGQAAGMLNISSRSVADAKYVLEHGTPGLVNAVESGAFKVSAAKAIADLPPEEQRRIVQEKDKGARGAAIKKASAATKKKNKVKVPPNEQPAPKRRRGSRPWLKDRVRDLGEVVRDLREAVPELSRPLFFAPDHGLLQDIVAAEIVLGHIERIARNPVQVKEVSLALVKLWNQQKGAELKDLSHLLPKVHEAVACELDRDLGGLDRWTRVIQKIAAKDPSWFTSDNNFNRLIATINGVPSGLEEIEKEFGAPEAPEAAAEQTAGGAS